MLNRFCFFEEDVSCGGGDLTIIHWHIHWSVLPIPSCLHRWRLFLIPPTCSSTCQPPHLFILIPTLEECRVVPSSPFWWACLGGSPWSQRGRNPPSTDAWPLWTWWPWVWAAPWAPGSTFSLEKWPETQLDRASSSPSSLLPWHPYLQDCAMQNLGLGSPKQDQRTFTATWQLGSCWLSSLGGICYSPMS